MGAVSNTYGMGEAAVLAVEAGCDLLLVCHGADNLTAARDALLEAADSGRISPERLDESVKRILSLKGEYGLTNEPVDTPDVDALNATRRTWTPSTPASGPSRSRSRKPPPDACFTKKRPRAKRARGRFDVATGKNPRPSAC